MHALRGPAAAGPPPVTAGDPSCAAHPPEGLISAVAVECGAQLVADPHHILDESRGTMAARPLSVLPPSGSRCRRWAGGSPQGDAHPAGGLKGLLAPARPGITADLWIPGLPAGSGLPHGGTAEATDGPGDTGQPLAARRKGEGAACLQPQAGRAGATPLPCSRHGRHVWA